MIALETIFFFVFGAIVGSFLNVVILRMPEEKSMGGRSHCPNCGHELGISDLFPLFSYLFLGGKCRYCKSKISIRYFLIEGLTGFLFALTFAIFAARVKTSYLEVARLMWIVAVLVVIFVVDLERFLILDKVVLPATIILFILNIAVDVQRHSGFSHSLTISGILSGLAVLVLFGAIYFVSKGTAIGFGDVKFSMFLGLATPGALMAVNLFLCFFFGAIVGMILIAFRNKSLKTKVPLGVFLSASTALTLFFGNDLWLKYLNLIGWR